jgi:hypothetical protein
VGDEERRARLAVRHALSPFAQVNSPEAATRAMTVLHATEPATVYLSCRARVPGVALSDIASALYEQRSLVKQLAMRRTLFVFPRDLLPAVWPSASARVAASERARMAKDLVKAGITADGGGWLDAARGEVLAVLDAEPDGRQANDIRRAVPMIDVKVPVTPGGGWSASRVLTHLGATGDIVRGVNIGGWHTSRPRWTLTRHWLGGSGHGGSEHGGSEHGVNEHGGPGRDGLERGGPELGGPGRGGPELGGLKLGGPGRGGPELGGPELGGPELGGPELGAGRGGLGRLSSADGYREIVRRWLWSFGPGSEDDIVWWLGATKTIVRAALAEIGAVAVTLDHGGTGWLRPDDLDEVADPGPWVALLPVLDPTVMGWQGRGFYLGPHRDRLFDNHGNAGTTAWADGRVVGCWVQDAAGTVEVRLVEEVPAATRAALDAEAKRLTAWLDGFRVPSVYSSPAMRS